MVAWPLTVGLYLHTGVGKTLRGVPPKPEVLAPAGNTIELSAEDEWQERTIRPCFREDVTGNAA
jgi:hypothetical protein